MTQPARRRSRAAAALALALLAFGCSDESEEETPAGLLDEIQTLQQAITEDLELLALDDVEAALADDLPVRAGDLLEAGALPAARRHAETVAALELENERALRFRDEAAELLQRRATALEGYRELLRRGLVEDLALLDSLSEQRTVEEEIEALLGRLEAIRPLQTKGKNRPRPRRRPTKPT
ncbi:MAG: hypothetical protein AAGE52_36025 [Myxococcota bacterium]